MKIKLLNALTIALILFHAMAPIGALAWVGTDQADYAPGSVVTISGDNTDGAGYVGGESVHVDVWGPNGYTAACDGTADDNGAWSCQVTLWATDLAWGSYSYTATGQTSGVSQSGTFTDAVNINSFASDCSTASDSFTSGAPVCAKVTGLGGGGGSSGKIEWWAPGASSATRTTTFSGVSGNTSDTFAPTVCGTWTLKVYSPAATFQDDDTFSVTSCTVTTTTSISAPTITYNANGSVTVTVSSGSGTPTGDVSLSVDSGSPVTKALSSGSATFTNTDIAALTSPNAGDHSLSANYAAQGSFEASSATGTLHVNKATPTLSVTNSPVTYDGNSHAATVTGSVAGSVSNILTGGAASQINAGTYAVTADFAPTDTTNYNSLTGASAGNFIIGKSTPTLSVTNSPATYNGVAQAATVTGSVLGHVSNILTGGAVSQTNVGTYAVTADFTPTDTTNYSSLTGASAGNFVINQASVTATAGSGSGTYNGSVQSPSACVVTGAYTGDLTCTNSPTSVGPAAGTHVISADVNGTGFSNFDITYVGGFYTIDKAEVTATAGGGSGTYNGSVQSPSACVVSGVYTGNLTCENDPASVGPDAGTYTISADVNGTGLSNFDITYVGGSYTIDPAPVTATAGSGSGTYSGLTQSPSACVVSGDYTGDLTCENDPASAGPDAGTYVISADVSGTGMSNFDITYVDGSYTIDPAPLTITANNKSIAEGDSWPTFDVSYDGLVNGEGPSVLGGTLVCESDAPNPTTDNSIFQINCSGLTSDNYSITFEPGTLTVTNVAPTATLANNGPVNEGSPATVSFSGQFDPSSADTAAGFHYAFSCTNGSLAGATYAGSGTSASTNCTFNENGSYTVKGRIFDKDGGFTEYTTVVTVNNVAPTLSLLTVNGNSGTACTAGNSVNLSFSFTDPGSADTFTGTINWGDGNTTNFSSSPVNVSHNYVAGTYTITVTVTDDDGGSDSDTASVSHLYNVSAILQPINVNGTRSSFKIGSTIPVKVKVMDCNGATVSGLTLHVRLQKLDSSANPVNESIETSVPDAGDIMRYDASGMQYIYNLSTKRSQLCATMPTGCTSTGDLTVGSYRITVFGALINSTSADIDTK